MFLHVILQSVAIHPHFSKSTNRVLVIGTDRVCTPFVVLNCASVHIQYPQHALANTIHVYQYEDIEIIF